MNVSNYYKNSVCANELLKADEALDFDSGITHNCTLINNKPQKLSGKRSRTEFVSEDMSSFFKAVIKEYDHAQIVPILKMYLDTNFNILISKVIQYSPETDLDALLQHVCIFRNILSDIDREIYKENFATVYKILGETLFHQLLVSKEIILNFNRVASRIVSHFEN